MKRVKRNAKPSLAGDFTSLDTTWQSLLAKMVPQDGSVDYQALQKDQCTQGLFRHLATHRLGLASFSQYPELLYAISPQTLNHCAYKHGHSLPPLLYLLCEDSDVGVYLLSSRPHLFHSLDASGCNYLKDHGGHQGASVCFWVTRFHFGCDLLLGFEQLSDFISEKCFNAAVLAGPYKTQSPLSNCVLSPKGHELLKHSTKLVELISIEAFNRPFVCPDGVERSPALVLIEHDRSFQVFREQPHLLSLIDEQTLNQEIEHGPWKGQSIWHMLCMREQGRALIYYHPEIIDKVTEAGNSRVVGDYPYTSPLSFLASDEIGREILQKYPSLLEKANEEVLNHGFCVGIEDDEMSVIAKLIKHELEFGLVLDNPFLIDRINADGITRRSDQGDFANKNLKEALLDHVSLYDHFVTSENGCRLLTRIFGVAQAHAHHSLLFSYQAFLQMGISVPNNLTCALSSRLVSNPVSLQGTDRVFDYQSIYWYLYRRITNELDFDDVHDLDDCVPDDITEIDEVLAPLPHLRTSLIGFLANIGLIEVGLQDNSEGVGVNGLFAENGYHHGDDQLVIRP